MKLIADQRATPIEELRLDASSTRIRAVRTVASPGYNEVAKRIGSHRGTILPPSRVGVDLELSTNGLAVGVVELGLDTPEARIRPV